MSIGIRCLLGDDAGEARALALQLDELNAQRREIEAGMQAQALAAVRALGTAGDGRRRAASCLFDATWHQGVVGLVASRIKDRCGRPVIAFAPPAMACNCAVRRARFPACTSAMCSRRSPRASPALIVRFGGHAMAAGLTLDAAHLDRLRARLRGARWPRGWRRDAEDAIETDGELARRRLRWRPRSCCAPPVPGDRRFPSRSSTGSSSCESARVVGERHCQVPAAPRRIAARFDAIAFNLLDPEAPEPHARQRAPGSTGWIPTTTRASGACSCSSITCCRPESRRHPRSMGPNCMRNRAMEVSNSSARSQDLQERSTSLRGFL